MFLLLEMVRMANVYYNEGSLENAYVLYLKFMTLFLEKIRKHPEFNTVPVDVKARNQCKLREILPKAEKLKQQLLEQYKDDYNRYLAEVKHKKDELEKKKKDQTKKGDKSKLRPSDHGIYSIPSIAKVPGSIADVSYPDSLSNIPVTPTPSAPPPPPTTVGSKNRTEDVPMPVIDRSNKPSEISVRERYDTKVLRRVIVPVKVMTLFQAMAQTNTHKNIETCGVLTGKLERNELIITHMIVPKQKGTSDSCMTMNEEEIFDYQDQHNLITIGWIHTHPTQTAFLSSVDLHTHCPYQLLMPEAIAIVCSPKYNETGFFILTPSYGLPFIANCRKTGFHPHPTDPPLFMVADHVRIENNAPLEVLDLRKA
ncbi:STAM-binding protein isoform X2 [Anoplophora glabripennis]|uniref:STAM-binding protein isoform X2 n=1 Tax=Anoplophora glabripennis TaxID=217634 RepID=UPI0008736E77|nr:STAM-binding protein isoform X2 [Anoplophora glabripennis]